ncbi:hypothetical protein LSH36_133g03030 [Paralvinella palmiformis]|uniref:NIF system FeS cluster assembly NifU N-terminal domain-containing protein n=1 Tax=Paralvinella palmiformis TaxID=53620 RepID=A0AAD9JVY5_9ANNE|nr:hypothetical protein LSH36_133g03030 [Paralvinella palmiformis]
MALFRAASNTARPLIKEGRLAISAACYHKNVIDHYENPRNVGTLDKNDKSVGTGLIKVDKDGKIVDAKFKTFGCGSAIASSSLATTWIKGKTLDEAGTIKNKDIAKELCLPPVKLHCSMLAEDAIRAALQDYKIKNEADSNKDAKTEKASLSN